jgi:hypothetical protein
MDTRRPTYLERRPQHGNHSRLRQSFTPEDDALLKELVEIFGDRNWKAVARRMTGFDQRQCRERYKYYLAPSLTNGPWCEDEDLLLRAKVAEMGQRWAQMTEFFVGRSDVNLKNRYSFLTARDAAKRRDRELEEAHLIPRPSAPIPSSDEPEVCDDECMPAPERAIPKWSEGKFTWMDLYGLNLTNEYYQSRERKNCLSELYRFYPDHTEHVSDDSFRLNRS